MNTYESLPEVDQLAVQRDAEHLDALARRDTGGPSEGVHALLWALGADVDEGLAALLAAPMPDARSEPAVVLSLVDASRRRGARALTAALLATGLVSLSGVAAAVTGDPLSPYRSVISAVTDDEDQRSRGREDERVERQLSDVRTSIGDGDFAGAHAGVETLRADLATLTALSEGKQHSLMRRLAVLEAQLARAEVKDARDAAKDASKDEAKGEKAGSGGQGDGTKPDKTVPLGQTGSRTEPGSNGSGSRSTAPGESKKTTATDKARSSAKADTSDPKAPKG